MREMVMWVPSNCKDTLNFNFIKHNNSQIATQMCPHTDFKPWDSLALCVQQLVLVAISWPVDFYCQTRFNISTMCIWDLDLTMAKAARWLFSGQFWPLVKLGVFFEGSWGSSENRLKSKTKPPNHIKLL